MPAFLPRLPVATGLALAVTLVACSGVTPPPTTPQLDAAFGESVRQVRAVQTVDPDAARKAGEVAGIDGESGRSVMEEYQKSFKEPPRTFNILGIGGSAVGGR